MHLQLMEKRHKDVQLRYGNTNAWKNKKEKKALIDIENIKIPSIKVIRILVKIKAVYGKIKF